MRKRRFRGEVHDELLPGGRVPAQRASSRGEELPRDPEEPIRPSGSAPKKASPRTKRVVALCVVILVSVSIPILALLLIFAG
jgi:hypothetical protein